MSNKDRRGGTYITDKGITTSSRNLITRDLTARNWINTEEQSLFN